MADRRMAGQHDMTQEPAPRTDHHIRPDHAERPHFDADRWSLIYLGLTRSLVATKHPSISLRENGRVFGTIYMDQKATASMSFGTLGEGASRGRLIRPNIVSNSVAC